MSGFSNCIIAMLRASPNGLTAKDFAERLGTAGSISSRLSKLAAYGIIGKVRSAGVRPGLRGTIYQALSDDVRLPDRFSEPSAPLIGQSLNGRDVARGANTAAQDRSRINISKR
jgi:hypothetical protein